MDNIDRYIQKVSDIFLCYGVLQTCIGLAKVFNSKNKLDEAYDCCEFADAAFDEIMKRIDFTEDIGDEVVVKL